MPNKVVSGIIYTWFYSDLNKCLNMNFFLLFDSDSFDVTERAVYADLHHGKIGVNEDTVPSFFNYSESSKCTH